MVNTAELKSTALMLDVFVQPVGAVVNVADDDEVVTATTTTSPETTWAGTVIVGAPEVPDAVAEVRRAIPAAVVFWTVMATAELVVWLPDGSLAMAVIDRDPFGTDPDAHA